MPGQTLTTEAFVIEKRPAADAFQAFGLFSAEHGNLLALQRVPRRPSASQVALDLFDEVSAMLESSNQGRTWFVREVRIDHAARGNRQKLRGAAVRVGARAVISRNPVHEESRENVAQLLRTALGAFVHASRPDIVHFKSLYVFARDEGYPVKQEWIPSLPGRGPQGGGGAPQPPARASRTPARTTSPGSAEPRRLPARPARIS